MAGGWGRASLKQAPQVTEAPRPQARAGEGRKGRQPRRGAARSARAGAGAAPGLGERAAARPGGRRGPYLGPPAARGRRAAAASAGAGATAGRAPWAAAADKGAAAGGLGARRRCGLHARAGPRQATRGPGSAVQLSRPEEGAAGAGRGRGAARPPPGRLRTSPPRGAHRPEAAEGAGTPPSRRRGPEGGHIRAARAPAPARGKPEPLRALARGAGSAPKLSAAGSRGGPGGRGPEAPSGRVGGPIRADPDARPLGALPVGRGPRAKPCCRPPPAPALRALRAERRGLRVPADPRQARAATGSAVRVPPVGRGRQTEPTSQLQRKVRNPGHQSPKEKMRFPERKQPSLGLQKPLCVGINGSDQLVVPEDGSVC